jgi:hypothetical protein
MQMGAHVENVSGGNATMLASGGFSLRAKASPVGPLGRVMELVVRAGAHEGTLHAAWKRLRGAGSYEIHVSPDPLSDTTWGFYAVSIKSSATLEGFTSGSRIWVRVRGIGANNQSGAWSDPAVKVVP